MTETIIIGAGLTGLSCAYHLNTPYLILEKEKHIGGLCSSVKLGGFTFDYSGHFLHIHHNNTKKFIRKLLENNLARIIRKSFIYTHNTYVPYPFQANLYWLPPNARKECLNGFLKKPANLYKESTDSFYNWSLQTFGSGITKYFMKPYNEKLWTISSDKLTADWVAPFVPRPSLKELINGTKKKQAKDFGYNVSFYYPERGGCQSLIDSISSKVKNTRIKTASRSINTQKKYLETSNGKRYYYKNLISTQPLPDLLGQITDLPSKIKSACKKLDWNSVCCLNIGIKRTLKSNKEVYKGKHWVYFPEKRFIFYRVGIYSNIMPTAAPSGYDSLYIEVSHRPNIALNKKAILEKVKCGLRECNILRSEDEIGPVNWLSIPYAYVIYNKHRPDAVKLIQEFLKERNIFSIGRYGAWKYSFMEESIIDGKNTAEIIEKC